MRRISLEIKAHTDVIVRDDVLKGIVNATMGHVYCVQTQRPSLHEYDHIRAGFTEGLYYPDNQTLDFTNSVQPFLPTKKLARQGDRAGHGCNTGKLSTADLEDPSSRFQGIFHANCLFRRFA